ncbi:MAG: ATP-binding protein [Bacteroidales bacterium]|nr:ATP-binding protein [Bacteroidales bacterium]
MKIRDFKIGTQLKIGFGLILIFITLLSYIAWKQTDRMGEQTSKLYNHSLVVRRAIGQLKYDVLIIHRGMKDLVLTDNKDDLLEILSEIEFSKSNVLSQLALIKERFQGPPEYVESAHANFIKWNTIREETINIYNSGKGPQAAGRTLRRGVGGEQVDVILADLLRIDKESYKIADENYERTLKLNKTLNLQLTVFTLFILLISLIIIYILMHNIRAPLTELLNLATLFISGDTGVRSSYSSRNEFGRLSASFNRLAESIEDELELNKRSVTIAKLMVGEDDSHRFSHILLRALADYTGAQMGALYMLSEDRSMFEHYECIGMNYEGCRPFSAKNYEGEFGKALSTGKIQYVRSIPEDCRFSFSTVTGDFKPKEIITIPVISSGECVAMISLCSLSGFDKSSLNLIFTIHNTINARMSGILAYRKIVKVSALLEQQNSRLEQQKLELEQQKRELESQKSELYALTDELTEHNRELDIQKEQLSEASRLKTTFLSNMSHELRTPLNSVIALSGVLGRRLNGKIPPEEHGYLDVISRNGKQLLELINDILDLAKIESGREDLIMSVFNITTLIDEAVDMISPLAVQKGLTIKRETPEHEITVKSDYGRCRHIIQNILSNAVKFTIEGEITISSYKDGENAVIKVADTGIGIDKDHIPYIFDEFRQVDSTNSKSYGGSGLGLAIAKKNALLIGGEILVESTKGIGSIFTTLIPAYFVSPEESTTGQSKESSGSLRRILIVEDTEALVIQLRDILEEEGYIVDSAVNGVEALKKLSVKNPDALILDLMMPEMDGFETLKKIREQKRTSMIPILILTAKYLDREELSQLKHNNVQQLIRKGDISKDQLLKAVETMIGKNIN